MTSYTHSVTYPGGRSATAYPTTKSVSKSFNTSKTSSSTSARQLSDVTKFNKRNVSQDVLDLINKNARGFLTNNVLTSKDVAAAKAANAAHAALTNFNKDEIIQGASGNVADLKRQLMEQVLPQITGGIEASGTSNNALGGLLANDAAIRTAEAQARTMEQARSNAAQELVNLITGATQASQGGSAMQDAVANFINATKGTVEQGSNTRNLNELIANSQTDSTSGNEVTNTYDAEVAAAMSAKEQEAKMAKYAMLQSLLPAGITMTDALSPFDSSKFRGNFSNMGLGRSVGRLTRAILG